MAIPIRFRQRRQRLRILLLLLSVRLPVFLFDFPGLFLALPQPDRPASGATRRRCAPPRWTGPCAARGRCATDSIPRRHRLQAAPTSPARAAPRSGAAPSRKDPPPCRHRPAPCARRVPAGGNTGAGFVACSSRRAPDREAAAPAATRKTRRGRWVRSQENVIRCSFLQTQPNRPVQSPEAPPRPLP